VWLNSFQRILMTLLFYRGCIMLTSFESFFVCNSYKVFNEQQTQTQSLRKCLQKMISTFTFLFELGSMATGLFFICRWREQICQTGKASLFSSMSNVYESGPTVPPVVVTPSIHTAISRARILVHFTLNGNKDITRERRGKNLRSEEWLKRLNRCENGDGAMS